MAEDASPWTTPAMVESFARSSPNPVLMRYADGERMRPGRRRALDIGCGAGRNALALGAHGWDVVGIDSSEPMLAAASARLQDEGLLGRGLFARARMDALPVPDRSMDLIVAHGIWNLADSSSRFRRAVREAARVAARRAALFVFTFSRNTLPPGATPVSGEDFVFTQFSGQPQCFLTADQLIDELQAAGFDPDPAVPLTEYNRRAPGTLSTGGPVIYEAAFRYR